MLTQLGSDTVTNAIPVFIVYIHNVIVTVGEKDG